MNVDRCGLGLGLREKDRAKRGEQQAAQDSAGGLEAVIVTVQGVSQRLEACIVWLVEPR